MSTVIRVKKNKNYTVMGNYHLQDKRLSLKAKGLLSLMLSLPDSWDYTEEGLTAVCVESRGTIHATLKELEENGYLERTQRKDKNGRFGGVDYTVYEKPSYKKPLSVKPMSEKPQPVKPMSVFCTQLNTNQLNTKELNTNKSNTKERGHRSFVKPTIEEIRGYIQEKGFSFDAEQFFDFYESKDWMIGKNKMKDWKAACRTWGRRQHASDNRSEAETGRSEKADGYDWDKLTVNQ